MNETILGLIHSTLLSLATNVVKPKDCIYVLWSKWSMVALLK